MKLDDRVALKHDRRVQGIVGPNSTHRSVYVTWDDGIDSGCVLRASLVQIENEEPAELRVWTSVEKWMNDDGKVIEFIDCSVAEFIAGKATQLEFIDISLAEFLNSNHNNTEISEAEIASVQALKVGDSFKASDFQVDRIR